ncbi:hypothetical protein [Coprobacter sp.]
MAKKNEIKSGNFSLKDHYAEKRHEILDLCYSRLREMIPECNSEVNLLKCIEILEKYENSIEPGSEQQTLCAIADTLDRLAELQ